MYGLLDLELARERRRELLWEAEGRRLAREVRRSVAGGTGDRGAVVRWGLAEDEPAVAELLELNGMPRWIAFEERFILAEKDGRLLGALRYVTESKRLIVGVLVVNPWVGERRTARTLYTGCRELARELGASEVIAAREPRADYPREAGYRRSGRRWRSAVPRSGEGVLSGSVWRRVFGFWEAKRNPSHRKFH